MEKIYIAGAGGMLGDAFYKIFKCNYDLKCTDIDVNSDSTGIIGIPVFSNSPERGVGLVYFTGPTMGYLIGFFSACFLASYIKNQDNYLWKSSLYRLFYINSLIEEFSINNFIHFDLDVLIYKSFDEIKHVFKPNKINITPGNESNIILGYCYVDEKKIFNELCDLILEILNSLNHTSPDNFFPIF